MNIKRAIWLGVLTYITSFIVGIILAAILGIDITTGEPLTPTLWYLSIIFTIIVSAIFTYIYFKDEKTKPDFTQGIYFGFVLIVIGFIIDSLIIIPYILQGNSKIEVLSYYTEPFFWLSLVLLLVTTSIIGHFKGRK
jgi:ABC-type spermidine/putrescine transport system permease subunit II